MAKAKFKWLPLLEAQIAEDEGCTSKDYTAPSPVWGKYKLCGICFGERDGCVNESSPFWRDDVMQAVINLFYGYYKVIRDAAEDELGIKMPEWIKIVVEPNYEDTSSIILFTAKSRKVLFTNDCKPWHFSWETPEELEKSLEEDYRRILANFGVKPKASECGEGHYTFSVGLSGHGKNADEAWQDACEGFSQDPGATPDEFEFEPEE